MCLIAWRTAPLARWPLVLAANRDEFHGREARPIHRWAELPISTRRAASRPSTPGLVIAGRDLLGGGTWLGLARTARGLRVAMLTNLRNGRAPRLAADAPSRGLLVTDVLAADGPAYDAMARLADGDDLPRMAGFNLVAIDLTPAATRAATAQPGRASAWTVDTSYLSHAGPDDAASRVDGPLPDRRPRSIDAGLHGLSNGALDAPWPKTRALMAAVAQAGDWRDAAGPHGRADALLLDCLADRRPASAQELPDTGIDRERERWLSSPFIASEQYGTRCSTLIAVDEAGRFEILERCYDRNGQPIGDTRETG